MIKDYKNIFILLNILFLSPHIYPQVGINKENPESTLHVGGNMIIQETKQASDKDKLLFWNRETGEIQFDAKGEWKYPIYSRRYKVNIVSKGGRKEYDPIDNMEIITDINPEYYSLFVVGANEMVTDISDYYYYEDYRIAMGIRHISFDSEGLNASTTQYEYFKQFLTSSGGSGDKDVNQRINPVLEISVKEEPGSSHYKIRLGHILGRPPKYNQGAWAYPMWTVDVLIIAKGYIQEILPDTNNTQEIKASYDSITKETKGGLTKNPIEEYYKNRN